MEKTSILKYLGEDYSEVAENCMAILEMDCEEFDKLTTKLEHIKTEEQMEEDGCVEYLISFLKKYERKMGTYGYANLESWKKLRDILDNRIKNCCKKISD